MSILKAPPSPTAQKPSAIQQTYQPQPGGQPTSPAPPQVHHGPGLFFYLLLVTAIAMIGGIVALLMGGVPDTPAFRHRMFVADYRAAHMAQDRKDWMGLLDTAEAMKGLDPDAFPSYALRGEAEYRLGRYRDAISDTSCALQLLDAPTAADEMKTYRRLSPATADATIKSVAAGMHAALGRDEYQFGLYNPALDDCNAALRLSPGLEDALFWRAVVDDHMHRIEPAIAETTTLIAKDPSVAVYYELRSHLYRTEGKGALAAPDTRRASALDVVNDPALVETHPATPQLDALALGQLPVRAKLAYD